MGKMRHCPSCGRCHPWLVRVHHDMKLFDRFYVECWHCHFCGKTKIGKRRAIKAWNSLWRNEI